MITIPILILLVGETVWGSSALLTAPPMWANVVCILAGIGYFYYWEMLVELNHRERSEVWDNSLWGRFSIIVFLPAILMPYCLRLGIEITSFSFFNPAPSYSKLLIVSASGGRSWGNWLDVQLLDKKGREPRVRVTEQLHKSYRHITTHKKDCLMMTIQTGRWGVVRVLRPTYWDTPIDTDSVHENCVDAVNSESPQTNSN